MHTKQYKILAIMTLLHFMIMYALMYSMVNIMGNVYLNLNQAYMTGLMTVPMVFLELLLMRAMYPSSKLNSLIIISSILLVIFLWLFIRNQTIIYDKQFLRSMIPHHAGAILMCEQAPIKDPEIQKLCKDIIEGQQKEIDMMKRKLQNS
ncbi:DUF305 domain-containing protein [Candidatus Berkiella aquae]|uniref:DUF305 domain-containing protein n=1 Tax=Candidatus Berkiella aquae TaxID=295108 RepID=A0A0Q9YW01_9GAMM|nr:DUF305 domain-containing protein [Candidatus Berkiella aquae]MCS5712787.1 DUF305 domain-containing protein [Candidatus Berkiella aquae]